MTLPARNTSPYHSIFFLFFTPLPTILVATRSAAPKFTSLLGATPRFPCTADPSAPAYDPGGAGKFIPEAAGAWVSRRPGAPGWGGVYESWAGHPWRMVHASHSVAWTLAPLSGHSTVAGSASLTSPVTAAARDRASWHCAYDQDGA